MKTLEKISSAFGKYMAIIVLVVAVISLFVPKATLWVQTTWVNYLLQPSPTYSFAQASR